MIRSVFRKEYAELLGEGRFRWAAGVVYGLFLMALLTGYRYYQNTHREHQQAQAASYRQWLGQGQKKPHSAAHYGFYAFKPVPLTALVDKGMDDYLGNAVWLEAHKQNEVQYRTAQDSADLLRFGSLTVGFIWQYLLPLVVILLTFNSISKEHESGTLRMLLSTETTGLQLVLGKALAAWTAVVVFLFLPTLLTSLVAMGVAGGGRTLALYLPNLAVWVILYLLFFALLTALGVAVSARLRQSGVALVVLLGGWAVGAFLIPRMAGEVAQAVRHTPSAFAFTRQVELDKAQGIDGHNPADKFYKDLEEKTLKQYGVDSISQLPVSFAGISLLASEQRDWEIFDRHYGTLFATFRRQNRLIDAFNGLSPVLAMQHLSRAVAGTDLDKHLHFTAHAEAFRRHMQKVLNEDMKTNAVGKDYDYKAGERLWQRVPAYHYQQPGIGSVLAHQAVNLAVLLGWLVLAGAFLWHVARNIRPY